MSRLDALIGNREAVTEVLAENADLRLENKALREEFGRAAAVMEAHSAKIRRLLAGSRVRTAPERSKRPAA